MGELVARKSTVNYCKEVVTPCVEQTEILFESHDITLTVDCPENVTVNADHDLLRIALTNYLTNAAKYGAKQTQVQLTVQEEQGILTTTVWNEGVGFSPGEQELLFAKFSWLKNQNTIKQRGSGLGLFLIKNIIDCIREKFGQSQNPDNGRNFASVFQ